MDSQNELERLKMARRIPDEFHVVKGAIFANAFGVFEAMLNLIGQQLAYYATTGGKLGSVPHLCT